MLAAPNFDDLLHSEYHSYIQMETPIGISGKSGIQKWMQKIISARAELPYLKGGEIDKFCCKTTVKIVLVLLKKMKAAKKGMANTGWTTIL